MTLQEAKQESDRIKQVVSSGRVLIVGEKRLAQVMKDKKYWADFIMQKEVKDWDFTGVELIHLPYCGFSPGDWGNILVRIVDEMSNSGVVRILAYNVLSGVVQYSPESLVPGFTKDSLIRLLYEAGFRKIVLDRRPFHRSARLLSGQEKGMYDNFLTTLYRVPAWLEARMDQGAVMGAFARK